MVLVPMAGNTQFAGRCQSQKFGNEQPGAPALPAVFQGEKAQHLIEKARNAADRVLAAPQVDFLA